MRNSLFLTVLTSLIAPVLGGCPSTVTEIRSQSDNRREFTSAKAPEALSGCITQGWADELALPSASPKADGWLIIAKRDDWVFGIAEITKTKTGTVVVYNSNFDRVSNKTYIPTIQKCI